MTDRRSNPSTRAALAAVMLAGAVLGARAAGPAAAVDAHPHPASSEPAPGAVPGSPAERCGVEAVALRPSFGGTMLDFRYRVLDAEKARPLFDRKIEPYLIDPATGSALGMPETTNVGALRASPRNVPVAGKQYFVLFANGSGAVHSGSRVVVVLGDCRFEAVVAE